MAEVTNIIFTGRKEHKLPPNTVVESIELRNLDVMIIKARLDLSANNRKGKLNGLSPNRLIIDECIS